MVINPRRLGCSCLGNGRGRGMLEGVQLNFSSWMNGVVTSIEEKSGIM